MVALSIDEARVVISMVYEATVGGDVSRQPVSDRAAYESIDEARQEQFVLAMHALLREGDVHERDRAARFLSSEGLSRMLPAPVLRALLDHVMEQARPVLEQSMKQPFLGNTKEGLYALRPQPEDYERVFLPSSVQLARSRYEALWSQAQQPLSIPPSTAPTKRRARFQLYLVAALAGALTADSMFPATFPGGYLKIAHRLRPERIWLCWKSIQKGKASGMAYDGLVWLGTHFSWFPRPWRVLRD